MQKSYFKVMYFKSKKNNKISEYGYEVDEDLLNIKNMNDTQSRLQ